MRPFDMVETEWRGMPAMDGTVGEAAPAGCHGWHATKHEHVHLLPEWSLRDVMLRTRKWQQRLERRQPAQLLPLLPQQQQETMSCLQTSPFEDWAQEAAPMQRQRRRRWQ